MTELEEEEEAARGLPYPVCIVAFRPLARSLRRCLAVCGKFGRALGGRVAYREFPPTGDRFSVATLRQSYGMHIRQSARRAGKEWPFAAGKINDWHDNVCVPCRRSWNGEPYMQNKAPHCARSTMGRVSSYWVLALGPALVLKHRIVTVA